MSVHSIPNELRTRLWGTGFVFCRRRPTRLGTRRLRPCIQGERVGMPENTTAAIASTTMSAQKKVGASGFAPETFGPQTRWACRIRPRPDTDLLERGSNLLGK